MNFKDFLLNEKQMVIDEDKKYFGQKVGDALSAIHDMEDNSKAVGTRKLTKASLTLVNQIRTILHDQWSASLLPQLQILQRVGVALMKAIDEKGDIADVLANAGDELEKITKDLGTPINHIGSGLDDGGSDDDAAPPEDGDDLPADSPQQSATPPQA